MQKEVVVSIILGDSNFLITGEYDPPINNFIKEVNEVEPIPAGFKITKINISNKDISEYILSGSQSVSIDAFTMNITNELSDLLNNTLDKKEINNFYHRLSMECLKKI